MEYLEEQSRLADAIARLTSAQPGLESAAGAARAPLEAAVAAIDGELASIAGARTELTGRLDAAHLDRYERVRARRGGVAVARLDGSRCGGCHLDLSTTELARSAPSAPAARRLPAMRADARSLTGRVFCWFIGTAIVTVWAVFRDPRFDYRLLVVGAVVPLVDGFTGGAWVLTPWRSASC